APVLIMPKMEHVCGECGKPIRKDHQECWSCAQSSTRARMGEIARIGRVAAKKPEARAKHSESARSHALARSSWDASSQPSWLTRECFLKKIQPLLSTASTSAIRRCIGVSHWYASKIRQGYRPHPRHWRALAELA